MIDLDAHTRRKVIGLAVMLAPVAAVQFVRMIDGPGLTGAPAATPPKEEPSPALTLMQPQRVLTPAQQQAMAYLRGLAAPSELRSPMDAPPPAPTAVAPEAAQVPTRSEPEPIPTDPLAGVTVTAILGSGDGAVAMIAHRLRRVGDEVVPGWRVKEIDGRRRRVVLVGDGGDTAELAPPVPGD